MKLWLIKCREATPEATNLFIVRAVSDYDARVLVARDTHNNDWYSPDFATCEQLKNAGDRAIIARGY